MNTRPINIPYTANTCTPNHVNTRIYMHTIKHIHVRRYRPFTRKPAPTLTLVSTPTPSHIHTHTYTYCPPHSKQLHYGNVIVPANYAHVIVNFAHYRYCNFQLANYKVNNYIPIMGRNNYVPLMTGPYKQKVHRRTMTRTK